MSNTTTISTAAIALNLTSLIGTLFMLLICIFMFSVIIHTKDVVLILAGNNYLALLGFSFVSVSTNTEMLRADFNWFIGEETLGCRIRSYVLHSLMGIIMNTFALQAAFRFFRVVYPYHIWLQHYQTYTVIIPIIWIISFLLVLPIYIWHDIQLIPTELVCLLGMHSARGFIWSTVAIYALPMNIITAVYLQLMRFLRRSSMVASARAKRDVVVVHRIVLVVSLLMLIGAPTVVLELMLPFTDVGKPLFYRISDITMVIAMIVLSFMLVYVTPQVKEILMRIGKQHQVAPSNTLPRSTMVPKIIKY